jgi:hypothetical protein
MSIIGLTDRPILRRDGKIRAGYKDEANGNKLVNTDHFILVDAPQLIDIYGDTAKEIFFTVHSDRADDFMKTDLRWYNASQLLCRSMHNSPDEHGKSMGSVAAYMGVNGDIVGLEQKPFPGLNKSRLRNCGYKRCPNHVKGDCSEHMFLDIIIPQYSMGGIFTLDSTSINAILNAHSTFAKAWTRYGGKLTGQIFKMYKKPGEIQYQKKDGSAGKREAPMVWFDMVNFDEYEAKFKNNIRSDDWEALMNLRNRQYVAPTSQSLALSAPDEAPQIAPPQSIAQIASAADIDPDAGLKVVADDPTFVKMANELAVLKGLDVVADADKIAGMRMATVKHKGTDLKKIIEHMQRSIKDAKKAAAPVTQTTTQATPEAGSAAGGLY